MPALLNETEAWARRIVSDQVHRYMSGDQDFINDDKIHEILRTAVVPSRQRVDEILAKSLAVETLSPEEAAALLRVEDAST